MAQPKFVDGKIKYMLRTFDGDVRIRSESSSFQRKDGC